MKRVGRHLALLRGINVGGRNKLPMKDLAALFTQAGCRDVRTYIQSGSVVFRAKAALAKRVPILITGAISDRFGYEVPVITRTADEISDIVGENPFLRGTDTKELHVVFLATVPATAQVAALDPDRSPPDEFSANGREVYLRCPNGLARTKLTNDYFDSKLKTTSTTRNWKTVLKLLDLTVEE